MYNGLMKSIQIRETPADLYAVIKDAAQREGRSLSQQALAFLAQGANVSLGAKQRRGKIFQNFQPFKISKAFDAAAEIAKDRKR